MVLFDVVECILLRLLVADLLRSKSVCKSWYSLITSRDFGKLISDKDHNRRIAMCKPYSRYYNHNANDNDTDCHYYHTWSIGGASNGLVCMCESSEPRNPIRVTNPWTRDFRELPIQPTKFCDKNGIWVEFASRRCLGFGYDSSTDDYKVVMANYTYNDSKALVHILSLKSNIWKLFGHVDYRFDHDELATPGILFNGALHWFWFDANYSTTNKALLVSFDLAKEKFIEIPQPDDERYAWSINSTLGILEDRLCIYTRTRMMRIPHNPPFSIWVMKNYYNVKPSWELLPITNPSEMKDHAIHYMLKSDIKFPYYCDDNIQLARSVEYIRSPIFVHTLVSPYVKEKGETEEEENGSK